MVRKSRCWPIAVALTLSLIISACSGDDDDGEAKRFDATATAERTQTAISDTDVDEGAKRTAINWARLIAASPRTCNDYMGQTACEQIKCQRAGGTPIPNCRPISSHWAATFRDATVQNIAISGDRAAATLSNNQTVQLQRIATGKWLIDKLGDE